MGRIRKSVDADDRNRRQGNKDVSCRDKVAEAGAGPYGRRVIL